MSEGNNILLKVEEIAEELSDITIQIKSLEDEEYSVVFRADGTGSFDADEIYVIEEFNHRLNLKALKEQFGDGEQLTAYVENYFWEEINPKLEDMVLRSYSDLEDHELEFVSGKPEEFDRLMGFFLMTEPGLERQTGNQVVVKCALEDQKAQLETWYSYTSERLNQLLRLALKEHQPYGYTYEYNEQAGDRRSGYSLTPATLTYELDQYLQLSARERMQARCELSEWLLVRNEDPASFGLSWEKIV